jgi:outer membrane lipoprotein-sorting protein
MRRLGTRTRWAVPAGAVAVAGVVIAATTVASASEPSLPARSAAQLLADVQQAAARSAGPMTATVQETTNLGIPALSQIGALTGQSGQLSALAGTASLSIWYLNPQHIRLAEPVQSGESDVRVDGTKIWLWDSKTQTATRILIPARLKSALNKQGKAAASSESASASIGVPTPLAAAREVLAAVGPSTTVRVGQNVQVAGRAAYQLEISPKGDGSLISRVLIAIDASRYLPLQVQVFARGSSGPALQVGFTALSFGRPAASNFSFTPPPGAKVKNVTVPDKAPKGALSSLGGLSGLGLTGLGQAGSVGSGGASPEITLTPNGQVANPHGRAGLPKAMLKRLRVHILAQLPKNLTKAQRAKAIKSFNAAVAGAGPGKVGSFGFASKASAQQAARAAKAAAPQVLGKDWTQVVATPPSPQVAALVQQLLAARMQAGPIKTGAVAFGGTSAASSSVSASQAYSSKQQVAGPAAAGPDLAILQALLKASTPVKGSWGSGRLLRSSLLTILITSNGRVLAGVVTPSVLYADAATLSK